MQLKGLFMQFQKKRPKNVIYLTQQEGSDAVDCVNPHLKI